MKTTIGKLRNITTGILHTKIDDVYLFFTEYLGMNGIMTHNLPPACRALEPILIEKFASDNPEWFIKEWIKTGLDEPVEIDELNDKEKTLFWEKFKEYNDELWNSIKHKTIVI